MTYQTNETPLLTDGEADSNLQAKEKSSSERNKWVGAIASVLLSGGAMILLLSSSSFSSNINPTFPSEIFLDKVGADASSNKCPDYSYILQHALGTCRDHIEGHGPEGWPCSYTEENNTKNCRDRWARQSWFLDFNCYYCHYLKFYRLSLISILYVINYNTSSILCVAVQRGGRGNNDNIFHKILRANVLTQDPFYKPISTRIINTSF